MSVRPHLTPVPTDPAATSRPPQPSAGDAPRRRRGIWLLALLLVIAGAAGFAQWRRAAGLEARVESLSGALADAQARVAAHREHLGALQERVGDLRSRFEALDALVQQDPEPGPAPPLSE